MPYVSTKQRGKFHSMLRRHEISKATVDEWDKASAGLHLPERVRPRRSPAKKHAKKRK